MLPVTHYAIVVIWVCYQLHIIALFVTEMCYQLPIIPLSLLRYATSYPLCHCGYLDVLPVTHYPIIVTEIRYQVLTIPST
jgi:hypothetical protein